MAFRFDSATHSYWLDDQRVPAISTVLRAAQSGGPWFTPEHRERGSAVHAATLAFDLGAMTGVEALSSIRPEWQPYLRGYLDFRTAIAARWARLEQPHVHRLLRFAGTPDRVGWIGGRPAILEIKTGSFADWHGMQTAAQDILLHRKWGTINRYVVYLLDTGEYKLRPNQDSGDYLRFIQALAKMNVYSVISDCDEGRD